MGKISAIRVAIIGAMVLSGSQAFAGSCKDLTSAYNIANGLTKTSQIKETGKTGSLQTTLASKLAASLTTLSTDANNAGYKNSVWAAIVNADGIVCAVTYADTSGQLSDLTKVWGVGRIMSAQKASTAASVSSNYTAFSTSNLYSASQPGGPFYGIESSNPLNTTVAYSGSYTKFGGTSDPLVGKKIGGINVFGGGVPLYGKAKSPASAVLMGGLGVAGDTSCTDHTLAWMTRKALKLDPASAGINAGTGGVGGGKFYTANVLAYDLTGATANTDASAVWDNIIYDITDITATSGNSTTQAWGSKGAGAGSAYFSAHGISAKGWGHPLCKGTEVHPAP